MRGYKLVADTRVDAIVVKEEDTIASPILDHTFDDFQREPLVPEGIDERKRRDKPRFFKIPGSFIIDLAAGRNRLVRQLLDARQLVYFFLKVLRCFRFWNR